MLHREMGVAKMQSRGGADENRVYPSLDSLSEVVTSRNVELASHLFQAVLAHVKGHNLPRVEIQEIPDVPLPDGPTADDEKLHWELNRALWRQLHDRRYSTELESFCSSLLVP